jgi:glycosyltransferase involved in cell wall biosynthesis
VNEVIVVDDASTDLTVIKAEEFGVQVVRLNKNHGKGNALAEGLLIAQGEIILMLDADLLGLVPEHIENLLKPLLNQQADMSVGKFVSGSFWTTLSQHITPALSGQRAIRREFLTEIPNLRNLGFGLEIGITKHFRKLGYTTVIVPLKGLNHLVKEKKRGLFMGFFQRLKMYYQILKVLARKPH